MSRSSRFLLVCAAVFLVAPSAALADLVLHSSMDNADVGAGLGTDNSGVAPFTVFDTVGGNNGQATNVLAPGGNTGVNPVTSGATGQIGQALTFPSAVGLNRGVTYGDVLDVGTGNYTVSAWFQQDSGAGPQTIAAKGNNSSGNLGWHIFTEGGNVFTRVGIGGTGATQRASMSDSFSLDEWNHVALVIDNDLGQVFGYLNGDLMANNGGGGPSDQFFTAGFDISSLENLNVGVSSGGANEFIGMIDDLGIFNEALSAADIDRIYQGGLAGVNVQQVFVPEPSGIALWSLLGAALFFWRKKRRGQR